MVSALIRVRGRERGGGVSDWVGLKGGVGGGGEGGRGVGRDPFVIPVNLDPGQGCPRGGGGCKLSASQRV